MLSQTLLLLTAFAGAALAQDQLSIETPASLIECQPVMLKWAGGVAPYYLAVIPGGQPSAAAIKDFGTVSGTSMTWTVDVASGQSVSLKITDSKGTINYDQAVTIQAGSSSACLEAGSSAMRSMSKAAMTSVSSMAPLSSASMSSMSMSSMSSMSAMSASMMSASMSSMSAMASSAHSSMSMQSASSSTSKVAASSGSAAVTVAAAAAATSKSAAGPAQNRLGGLVYSGMGLVGAVAFGAAWL